MKRVYNGLESAVNPRFLLPPFLDARFYFDLSIKRKKKKENK